ncbi:MAG: cold shock domain-containing protein [Clostridia bacterium]|nr:cold shock domain-containing protein [Clostridia bacterium]
MLGRVLWFDSNKGYGFIRLEDDRELFFHYSHIDMSNYKTIYSGTPVDVFMSEDGDIVKVTPQNRVSPSGKEITLVAFMFVNQCSELTHFNFDIARKAESGIKYITSFEDMIFCTDKMLAFDEKLIVRDIIINSEIKFNTPIQTNFRYDLMFI